MTRIPTSPLTGENFTVTKGKRDSPLGVRGKMAFLFLLAVIASSFQLKAAITPENLTQLNAYQDTLKLCSDSIVLGSRYAVRQGACFAFIKTLVRALKVDGSFEFPFDSLGRTIIIKSPDSKFRIFNWYVFIDDSTFRYYGAIQLNNRKKLSIFPFFDYSNKIKNRDTVTNYERWYGALYYKMIQKGKYYYLFGMQSNNNRSTKKLIDVLWFNKDGKPMFGAAKFENPDNKKKLLNRFVVEYKKAASVSVNYDNVLELIVYDHLTPPNDKSKGFYFTYIPDGTYEGFKYKGGHWVHIDEVFTSTQKVPPFPKPIDFKKKSSELDKK